VFRWCCHTCNIKLDKLKPKTIVWSSMDFQIHRRIVFEVQELSDPFLQPESFFSWLRDLWLFALNLAN